MRKAIFLLAAAAVGLAACGATRAEDGGPVVSRSFPVGAFTKLEVAGPFDVAVSTGKQPGAAVRGAQKLVERMVVEVEGDTLTIRPEKSGNIFGGFRWGGDKARVTVTVPMLEGAAIAGSGNVDVDRVAGDRFMGEVAGSGSLRVPSVAVKELQLEIAGSGDVDVAGQAESARYEIAGSGNIKAGGVASREARAEIAGSGNIEAQASGTAAVDIAGSGNVKVSGGAKCTVSKAGSGNVSCS